MTRQAKYWTSILTIFLLFLYFMPPVIAYSFSWTAFGFVFFVLPYIVYKTCSTYKKIADWSGLYAMASILIVGPTFGMFHHFTEVKS